MIHGNPGNLGGTVAIALIGAAISGAIAMLLVVLAVRAFF
jgi:hypothetical protein